MYFKNMKKIKVCLPGFDQKVDFGIMLLLLFIGLTVWLSYVVKKQYTFRASLEASIEQNRRDNFLLHNRVHLLNDALMENVRLKGERLSVFALHAMDQKIIDADLFPVLYLRAYSCEDCYSSIITSIIDRLSGKAGFHIVSHSSNKHYIDELYKSDIIQDLSLVLWDDNDLYSNSFAQSSAELILLDRQQRVNAMLPISFFLDPYLFSTYMAWVASGLQ